MLALATVTLFHAPDATRIIVDKAAGCSVCGAATFFFINRNGRTTCVHCDNKVIGQSSTEMSEFAGSLLRYDLTADFSLDADQIRKGRK